ncbi:sugar transporter ST2 [Besnoitia besnoiti]|uniref:Hexose transporter 1 n=1 Tax=Besnoitia besnoiti TaxID=94643 RepID=A0A2A9M603_BESBE|nr:sugar transporter ST2 [Besnoitia besnoiti]PFH31077.1 sugar transporter ST2 [Besnoitia besnoiti]
MAVHGRSDVGGTAAVPDTPAVAEGQQGQCGSFSDEAAETAAPVGLCETTKDAESSDGSSRGSTRRSAEGDAEADSWRGGSGSVLTSDGAQAQSREKKWIPLCWKTISGHNARTPSWSGFELEKSPTASGTQQPWRLLEVGIGGKRSPTWNTSKNHSSCEAAPEKTRFTPMMILVVSFTSLTGLLMGYDLCVVATVLSEIQENFHLCGGSFSCLSKSMFVAILAPGAAVGSVMGGWMSDRIGRKSGLALSDICLLLGSVAMGVGEAFWVMLLGRFLIGMGVGLGFVVYATYTSEVAPSDRRGQLVACQEVAQCFGCLVAYAMAACFGEGAWRYLLGMGGILAGVQVLGEIFILPESPRFFVQRGEDAQAAASLRKLGMKDEAEICRIVEELKADRDHSQEAAGACDGVESASAGPLEKLYRKWTRAFDRLRNHRRSLFVAVGCAVAQNMTAANSVIYFTVDVFRLAGVCNPLIPGVGVGVVKFLGVVVCIFLVDRWGRRVLLLTGTAGTFVCHLLMVTGFALQSGGAAEAAQAACAAAGGSNEGISFSAKLLISTLLLYIFFWNTSWAALMFVVASEVLPTSLRGLGMGLTITTFWLLSFVVQFSLEPLFSAISIPGTFGLFACLNFFALLFVGFFVPEAKGRSLEDMQRKNRSGPARTCCRASHGAVGGAAGLQGGEPSPEGSPPASCSDPSSQAAAEEGAKLTIDEKQQWARVATPAPAEGDAASGRVA